MHGSLHGGGLESARKIFPRSRNERRKVGEIIEGEVGEVRKDERSRSKGKREIEREEIRGNDKRGSKGK